MSASVRPIRPPTQITPQLIEAMRKHKVAQTADDQTTLLLDEIRELSAKLEKTIAALDSKTEESAAGHLDVMVEEMQKVDEKVEVVALALAERIGKTLNQIEGAVDNAVAELNKTGDAIKEQVKSVGADVTGTDSKLVHLEAIIAAASKVATKVDALTKSFGEKIDDAAKQATLRNEAVRKASESVKQAIATAIIIQTKAIEVAAHETEAKIAETAREAEAKIEASATAIGAQLEASDAKFDAHLSERLLTTVNGLKSLDDDVHAPITFERDADGRATHLRKGNKRYAIQRKNGRITGMK